MRTLYPTGAGQARAADFAARFHARMPIAAHLSAVDALGAESLVIDASRAEIEVEFEAARLEAEIRGLRDRLQCDMAQG